MAKNEKYHLTSLDRRYGSRFKKYTFWIPKYGNQQPDTNDWIIWQGTDKGRINGLYNLVKVYNLNEMFVPLQQISETTNCLTLKTVTKIMSKIANIVKNPSVIGQYITGVIEEATSKRNVYQLAFVKEEDGGWYIDLPEWTGAHANLAMVAGSDLLLDFLLKDGNRVEVEVVKSDGPLAEYDNDERFFRCEQIDVSLFGGSTYEVYGLEGFDHTIWICPVTLFVLGEYPKYIYIRNK